MGNNCPERVSETSTAAAEKHHQKLFDCAYEKNSDSVGKGGHGPQKKKEEWLLMYNLTVTDRTKTSDGKVLELGAPSKAEQLKQLAEKTKGTGVTIEVQVVNKHENATGNQQLTTGTKSDQKPTLERYELKDGQVRQKEWTIFKDGQWRATKEKPAVDFKNDLQDFMTTSIKENPAKKFGLTIFAHGGGNVGMQGDDSSPIPGSSPPRRQITSADDISDAVTKSLQGSGHKELDFFNHDGCNYGQDGSINLPAKEVVASPAQERSNWYGSDGQNLGASAEDVLKNPKMNGNQVCEKIIEEANSGKNDGRGSLSNYSEEKRITGTDHLAHYNMEYYRQFRQSMNELGENLTKAANDPSNKAAIQEAIDNTYRPGRDNHHQSEDGWQNKADIGDLTKQLRKEIDEHKLADPEHKLTQVLDQVDASTKLLVQSKHDATEEKSGTVLADLTTFLPDKNFNVDALSKASTPLTRFAEDVERFGKDFEETIKKFPDGVIKGSDGQPLRDDDGRKIDATEQELMAESLHAQFRMDGGMKVLKEHPEEMKELKAAVDELTNVHTPEQGKEALTRLSRLSKALADSKLNEQMAAQQKAQIQARIDRNLKLEMQSNSHWMNELIEKMRS
jgi:hypothetical protein